MTSARLSHHERPRRYRTILADPQWKLPATEQLDQARFRSPTNLQELTALPVSPLAEPDAYLWMWCTNVTLKAAYTVLESWEFTPRAPLTWIKPCPGLDTHLRSRTEHLILGTRGNAEINNYGQPTWMFAPIHEHRQRSNEEYAVIERLSSGPYLQLFTNSARPGWDTWPGPDATR